MAAKREFTVYATLNLDGEQEEDRQLQGVTRKEVGEWINEVIKERHYTSFVFTVTVRESMKA